MSTREVFDALSLAGFWLLLVAGMVRTVTRVAFYRSHGYRRPRLLTRDVTFVLGLSWSFGCVLFARVATTQGWVASDVFRESLWWGLVTVLPALLGVAVYTYNEFFVIERPGSFGDLERPDPEPSPDNDPRVPGA